MPRRTDPLPLIRPGMTLGHLLFHHWLISAYGAQDGAEDRPRYLQPKDDPDGPKGVTGFVEDINRLLSLEQLDHFAIKQAPYVYLWLVQTNAKHPRKPNAAIQRLIQGLSQGVVPAKSWVTALAEEHLA